MKNLFAKFFTPIKQLNKGTFRLLFVLSLLFSIIAGILSVDFSHECGELILTIPFWFIIYWLMVRVGLWIYAGFKEGKINKQ